MILDISEINFNKMNGLVPVCVQDAKTFMVLMMGFMNREAFKMTLDTKRVTFYSRTKERLWVKGETSGHFLDVVSMVTDCDNDSILIVANPQGPSCHLGTQSCFPVQETPESLGDCLSGLMQTLQSRQKSGQDSYTQSLFSDGIARIAQKIGEEGVEVALAAVIETNDALVNEVVDLLYHVLVLLVARDLSLAEITSEIQKRRQP